MPSLTLPMSPSDNSFNITNRQSPRSKSPTVPPFSPITPPPTQSSANLSTTLDSTNLTAASSVSKASALTNPTGTITSTARMSDHRPRPTDLATNTDAIALRSAISILQIQRQVAERDIQMLDRQRSLALANPDAFTHALVAGEIRTRREAGIGGFLGTDGSGAGVSDDEEDDVSGKKEHGEKNEHRAQKRLRMKINNDGDGGGNGDDNGDHGDGEHGGKDMDMDSMPTPLADFGLIPSPQNVVRCPPINWAKYHIVGEALDRLHAEQVKRPEGGDEYILAAPYRPWSDKVGKERKSGGGAGSG